MKAKITKRTVDAAKPGKRDQFIWDAEVKGFGFKLTPAGSRVYLLQTRVDGRVRRYTIGRHGSPWTPDQARTEARRLLGIVASGDDPAAERTPAEQNLTVSVLCDRYLDAAERGEVITRFDVPKKASTLAMDRSRINRHVKPLLGKKRVRDLTSDDIRKFMADVAAGKTATDEKTKRRGRAIVRGGRGAASRTVGMLGAILDYAVTQKLRTDNPCRGIRRFKDAKNERFLSASELTRLGQTLTVAESDGENTYAIAAIRALALTGCRRNEILTLRRAWIDYEHSALRLPDSKTGSKVVAIGAAALELFASIPSIEGCPFVFPNAKGDGHFVGIQRVWERIREKAGLADVRLHDLRHSFASVAATGGDSLLVIGALLGHRDAKTTGRYAHLTQDPVKRAADRISNRISAALKGSQPANVVPIKKA